MKGLTGALTLVSPASSEAKHYRDIVSGVQGVENQARGVVANDVDMDSLWFAGSSQNIFVSNRKR